MHVFLIYIIKSTSQYVYFVISSIFKCFFFLIVIVFLLTRRLFWKNSYYTPKFTYDFFCHPFTLHFVNISNVSSQNWSKFFSRYFHTLIILMKFNHFLFLFETNIVSEEWHWNYFNFHELNSNFYENIYKTLWSQSLAVTLWAYLVAFHCWHCFENF